MIELMVEHDLEEVMAIEKAVFTSRWTYEQFLYELKENPYSTMLVWRHDGKVIAYAGLWVLFERAEITTVAVSPSYQGQGYGRKLMKCLLRLAIQKGADLILLEVRPSNNKALNLYRSLGFEDLRIRKAYYQDDHEDALEMMMILGGRDEEDFSD